MWRPKSKSFNDPVRYEDVPAGHPARHFYDYWQKLCGDKAFPLKSDFNPAEVPRLLPNIAVVRLDYSGPEFDLILTLIGERLRELTTVNGPGSYRNDFFSGAALTERLTVYEGIAKNPRAAFFRLKVPFKNRQFIEIIQGMFPFSSDGEQVDYLFLALESI